MLKVLLDSWTEFESTKQVYIFLKRYCGSLWVKVKQSYKLSSLEFDKILLIGLMKPALPVPGRSAEFFLTNSAVHLKIAYLKVYCAV